MKRYDVEFHLYRKVGTESIIKFAPDASPEDKLKDEGNDTGTQPKTPAPAQEPKKP